MSCERIGKIIMTAASSKDALVIVRGIERENKKDRVDIVVARCRR